MTADEVQAHARVLANSSWCRYWLTYNARADGCEVAIQCRDVNGKPLPIYEAKMKGYTERGEYLYTAPRTTEAGFPYLPQMI